MTDPEILEKEYQEALKCKVEWKILDIKKSKLNDCENSLEIYIKWTKSYYKIIWTENSDYAGKKLCLIYTNFPIYNQDNIKYYPKKWDFFQWLAEQSELKSNKLYSISQTSSSTWVTIENTSNSWKVLEKSNDDLVDNLNNITNQENIKSVSLDDTIIKKPDVKIESNIVKNENLINTGTILNISSNIKDESKDNFVTNQDLTIESKNEVTQTWIITNKEIYLEKPVLIKQNNLDYYSQSYLILYFDE